VILEDSATSRRVRPASYLKKQHAKSYRVIVLGRNNGAVLGNEKGTHVPEKYYVFFLKS
jgi:hypothetical protein